MTTSEPAQPAVGRRVSRVDAGERVTGRAIYPADQTRPGMVVGRIKRSTRAHARIVSIDTSKARALNGVLAVITAADFPVVPPGTSYPFGEGTADAWISAMTVMARDRVLWHGHPVAAVAAVDGHVADAALALIDVSYEELPVYTNIDAAATARAIFPRVKPDDGTQSGPESPNAVTRTTIAHCDAEGALERATAIAHIDVTVDTAHQGYIEPHACVAETDGSGVVTVWASTQGVFPTELQLAVLLGLPQSQLRVIPLEVGGAFGGKITVHVEPIAARLAQITGRPVKIVTTREEVMAGGSGPAAAARIRVTAGADRDGRLLALTGDYRLDSGGLPGTPTTLVMQASAAPYQCETLRLEGLDVVTNKPRTEAYRGPGGIQAAFAMEQAIDELALSLGMCPLALRRRNAAVTGSRMPIGTPFPPIALREILDAVAVHPCWTDPLGEGVRPRGRGLALGYWRGTSMTSAAHITMTGDGRAMLTLGAVDITGTRTTMAQVAAEMLGIGVGDVYVAMGDSKSVGYTDASAGSRVGRTMTAAVVQAVEDVIGQLRPRAARLLQTEPTGLAYRAGAFHTPAGASITLGNLMRATLTEGAIVGRGVSTKLPLGVEFGAHVVDLDVDRGTGQVTVLRYTAFQDVGRALNPAAVEGQIEGSVVQGLGWALTEGFVYDDEGRLRNANLLDYRIPTALDVPTIDCVLLENPVPNVPYGVRGVGEMPIVPVAAAVGNAIRRAVGVRMTCMPMTPERVWQAIERDRAVRASVR